MINKHSFYIDEAIKEAKKSCMVKKHGCIIIKNNKIIGKGYNEYIKGMNNIYSIHAEKKAILNAKKNNDIKNSVLYVVRINNNNELDKRNLVEIISTYPLGIYVSGKLCLALFDASILKESLPIECNFPFLIVQYLKADSAILCTDLKDV